MAALRAFAGKPRSYRFTVIHIDAILVGARLAREAFKG
jgi:hypothetical protein